MKLVDDDSLANESAQRVALPNRLCAEDIEDDEPEDRLVLVFRRACVLWLTGSVFGLLLGPDLGVGMGFLLLRLSMLRLGWMGWMGVWIILGSLGLRSGL